ncbi:MAG: hypothetical protein LBI92_05390 [Azoarcus sp.]|nr:hypothetical protein [Azoarcus sp.]
MRRADFFVVAVFACLASVASGQGSAAKVFSCVVDGHTVFGDTLPKQCYGRAWVEKINGVVVYRETAQPTPDESARRREQKRLKEIAEQDAAKQRRQDEALLGRYASLEAFDRYRDREMGQLDGSIAGLRTEEQRLAERRGSFDADMAALGGKPVPPDLARAIAYADEELSRARAALELKMKERDELQQRFDAERRHYIEITQPTQDAQR